MVEPNVPGSRFVAGTIEIDRLNVYAYHGVLPQERTVGNDYEVSLRLICDISAAAASDDISLAVNYAEVVDCVREVMARPVNLLETLATRLRDGLQRCFPAILQGELKVTKLAPPVGARLHAVSVSISWQGRSV